MQRLWVCLVVCVFGSGSGVRAEDEAAVVRPADNGTALVNPGMGWVFHYYDNIPAHYGSKLAPSDTLDQWPGLSVIYLRIPWSYVEPAPGKAEVRQQRATFDLPFQLAGGEYEVFVSVGTATGSPRIALPLDGADGQRRYRLGTVRVVGVPGTMKSGSGLTLARRSDEFSWDDCR